MNNRIVLVVFALFAVVVNNACNPVTYDTYCTISGTVTEYGTNNPIQGADVIIQPAQIPTKTGSDGTFYFKDIDAGQLRVQAQKEGYESNTKTIMANGGETLIVDISLKKINYGK